MHVWYTYIVHVDLCEFYDGTVYDIVLRCCWWKYIIIIVPHLVWSAAVVILTSCFEGSSLSFLYTIHVDTVD